MQGQSTALHEADHVCVIVKGSCFYQITLINYCISPLPKHIHFYFYTRYLGKVSINFPFVCRKFCFYWNNVYGYRNFKVKNEKNTAGCKGMKKL